MLSEVTIVAIVGASATVLVGLAAAAAQIFGPAWRDIKAATLEREHAEREARFQRTIELVEALAINESMEGSSAAWKDVTLAEAALIATLRSGEGAVAAYVRRQVAAIRGDTSHKATDRISAFAENLLGYLRGDADDDDLKKLS